MKRLSGARLTILLLLAVAGFPPTSGGEAPRSEPLVPRAVLKLIIDHPALARYLHPEVPGRVPLVVSDHLLAEGVTPSKFGQPVRILHDGGIGSRPHLRFTSFAILGDRATAEVEFKAEGVVAVFNLRSPSPGWWEVVDAKVAER